VRAVYADPAVEHWHARTLDTDSEAAELVAAWMAGWRTGGRAEWAVVADSDGRLLGRVAVKVADPDGVGELAYWTAPEARGRRVASASVQAASAWAFSVGYQRLQLVHSVQNLASCRAATLAGYEAEGTLRRSALHADGWHDMHQHVLLA
jgi:ribosomal-protein-alanine N-acetyltransferase